MTVQFIIEFGDTSGDGHDKTDQYTVLVEGGFTEDQLVENFDKNAAHFGWHPELFAADYEDSSIEPEFLIPLMEAGMSVTNPDPKSFETWFWSYETGQPIPGDVQSVDALIASSDRVQFMSPGYLQVIMFMMGYGLDGFTWSEQKPTNFFREAKTVGGRNVGYGLFN